MSHPFLVPQRPVIPSAWSKNHSFTLPSAESADARKPPTNGYTSKVRVLDRYKIVGFISSGTYGRVYKAVGNNGQGGEFAIKKYVLLLSCFDSGKNKCWAMGLSSLYLLTVSLVFWSQIQTR